MVSGKYNTDLDDLGKNSAEMKKIEELVGQEMGSDGRYLIKGILGAGGMAVVYIAENRTLRGRLSAIKVPRPNLHGQTDLLPRFRREAAALAELSSPYIVTILDFGTHTDGVTPYMVMEFLDGPTLEMVMKEGPMSQTRVVGILKQVCRALETANQKKIIHRDLKPSNIFVLTGDVVKVTDFGLARLEGDGQSTMKQKLTVNGAVFGTPDYMSPEQAKGENTLVDQRSDIYSLGVIAYEMLSGALPFIAESQAEKLYMHVRGTVAQLEASALGESVDPNLARIVHRCLEKRPAMRYQTARDLLEDLERFERGEQPQLALAGVHRGTPIPPSTHAVSEMSIAVQPTLTPTQLNGRGESVFVKNRRALLAFAGFLLLLGGSVAVWRMTSNTNEVQRPSVQPVRRPTVTVDAGHVAITDSGATGIAIATDVVAAVDDDASVVVENTAHDSGPRRPPIVRPPRHHPRDCQPDPETGLIPAECFGQ